MKTICHRCQHLWRSKGKHLDRECPKCGSEYTGPTAKGGGLLGSLIKLVVILGVVGGAGYFYAKRAKDAPPEPEAAAGKPGDRPQGSGDAEDPTPSAAPTSAPTADPTPTRAPAPKPTAKPSDPPKPTPTTPTEPTGPKLKLTSQAGVALGDSYIVRGAIKNIGQTEATGVTVEVRFYAGSKRLAKTTVLDFPATMAAGARERFKVSYSGRGAEAVTRFKVKIRKD